MRYTFHGGLPCGIGFGKAIVKEDPILFLPDDVILRNLLSDECSLSVGDEVTKGEVIFPSSEERPTPTLSPISGRVKEVTPARIIIGLDKDSDESRGIEGYSRIETSLAETEPELLLDIIRKAAIATPASPMGAYSVCEHIRRHEGVRRVIIDCTSAEPFSLTNRYLLSSLGEELIGGAKILIRACEALGAIIMIDESHLPSIRLLERLVDGKLTVIRVTESKYPISNAKLLMHAAIGKECPPDKQPADFGCAIFDAEACVAVWNAVVEGTPMTERLLSVSTPDGVSLIRVPLGTRLPALAEHSAPSASLIALGAYKNLHKKEMLDSAVISSAERIVVLRKASKRRKAFPCTGCAECEDVCPMYLSPYRLLAARKNKKKLLSLGADCCIRCNCCSAVCPSGIDIPYYFTREETK